MGESKHSGSDSAESERRRTIRYDIRLPVQLAYDDVRGLNVAPATTKDVSDEGAFLVTNLLLPKGTRVELELQLELDSLLKLIGNDRTISVKTAGTVVRNEHHGLAVTFGRKVSFLPKPTGGSDGNDGQ